MSFLDSVVQKLTSDDNPQIAFSTADEAYSAFSNLPENLAKKLFEVLVRTDQLSVAWFEVRAFPGYVYGLARDHRIRVPPEALAFVSDGSVADAIVHRNILDCKAYVERCIDTIPFHPSVYKKLRITTIPEQALKISTISVPTMRYFLYEGGLAKALPEDVVFSHVESIVPLSGNPRSANFELFDCLREANANFAAVRDGVPLCHAIVEAKSLSDVVVNQGLDYLFDVGKSCLAGTVVQCAMDAMRWSTVDHLWSRRALPPDVDKLVESTKVPSKFMRKFLTRYLSDYNTMTDLVGKLADDASKRHVNILSSDGTFILGRDTVEGLCRLWEPADVLDASKYSSKTLRAFVSWVFESDLPNRPWHSLGAAVDTTTVVELLAFAEDYGIRRLTDFLCKRLDVDMPFLKNAVHAFVLKDHPASGGILKLCAARCNEVFREDWFYELPSSVQSAVGSRVSHKRMRTV